MTDSSWLKDYNYPEKSLVWTPETPLIPLVTFPHHPLANSQFAAVRNRLYKRGEACYLYQFFKEQEVPVAEAAEEFWIEVYGAVRVLTHKLYPADWIRDVSRPPPPEDLTFDKESPYLTWWGIAVRAQLWLDHAGITLIPHRAQYRRHSLLHTLPRRYYDV